MTNPFEDESGEYVVLINDEGQHSLWPKHIDVPVGWTVVHQADSRPNCLAYIEAQWSDMRPVTLVESMDSANSMKVT